MWIHDHGGILQQLENIMNVLSKTATQTYETNSLVKSHKIVEKTTNSAVEMIKADIDKSESGHIWRILNLNHGIIATRTHNTEGMLSLFLFEQLLLISL